MCYPVPPCAQCKICTLYICIYNFIYICNYLQILLIILPRYIYIYYVLLCFINVNAEDWNINASSLATQEAGTTTAQAAARKLSCAGCGDWRICLRWLAVPGCPWSILADPRTHTHTHAHTRTFLFSKTLSFSGFKMFKLWKTCPRNTWNEPSSI